MNYIRALHEHTFCNCNCNINYSFEGAALGLIMSLGTTNSSNSAPATKAYPPPTIASPPWSLRSRPATWPRRCVFTQAGGSSLSCLDPAGGARAVLPSFAMATLHGAMSRPYPLEPLSLNGYGFRNAVCDTQV